MNAPQLGVLVVVALLAVLQLARPALGRRWPRATWVLFGYPVAVVRVLTTWRRLTVFCDLAVDRRPRRAVVRGDLIVRGSPLRPTPPLISLPIPTGNGFYIRVRMHPGQVPDEYVRAALSIAHAWRVHAVRVESPGRGWLRVVATARDPLTMPLRPDREEDGNPLRAVVGVREDGRPWEIDFRIVPHWLIVGATRSGKSTLVNGLVCELAPRPVALVGIDLKGGLEQSLYAVRLSALATNRQQARGLLAGLVDELGNRMRLCRTHRVRSVWDLPADARQIPVVVLIDEIAELFLAANRAEKNDANEIATLLIRIAQLGAALGVHLVVAGQRVGSELGGGVTALRAQLAGRVCHRVADPETAVMALGDLNPDALVAAQAITPDEPGVAVVADGIGGWLRARSVHTSPLLAQATAERYAELTPELVAVTAAMRRPGGADESGLDDGSGSEAA